MIDIKRLLPWEEFDTSQINQLVARLAEDRGAARKTMTVQDIAQLLSNPNYYLLVAVEDGRYLGLVSIIFNADLGGRWLCNMYNMVVAKDIRNTGIGDLLREGVYREVREFARRERTTIHGYFTTQSPYILDTKVQERHKCILVAQAVGPMGTNLCKAIMTPDD